MIAAIQERNPREQVLIYAAMGLVLIFGIWQFAISPVLTASKTAQRAQTLAVRDFVIVRDGISVLETGPRQSAAQPFNSSVLVAAATQADIRIARLNPEADGQLKIWVEEVPATALMGFLQTLTSGYDTDIVRASINRTPSGAINAQITLRVPQ